MDIQTLLDKYKLPETVQIEITRNKHGFFAKLIDYPGCFTVANHPLELIQNVTDAILTYFEVSHDDAVKCNVFYGPPMPSMSQLEKIVTHKRPDALAKQIEFLYYASPYGHEKLTSFRPSKG